MTLEQLARAFYAWLRALSERSATQSRTVWRGLDPQHLQASWEKTQAADRLVAGIGATQLAATSHARTYVAGALAAQGAASASDGRLVPQALAGVASDGRSLDGLVLQPLIDTLARLAAGQDPDLAMLTGEHQLATIADTMVSDAGRDSVAVAMALEPAATGWIRMLVPPSCGRCAILAGRFYRWSDGFERHPNCDCVHVPSVEDRAGDLRTDPDAYFKSLSAADQDKYFTKSGAEAIRAGADMAQVVNARRGARGLSIPGRLTDAEQTALRGGRSRGRLERTDVYGRQVFITTEGTTKRAEFGAREIARDGGQKVPGSRYVQSRTPRLMPEAIQELAAGDRNEYIRLLRRFGYIR